MARKYLVVDDNILMSASVEYHSQLVPNNLGDRKILGGGLFWDDTHNKKCYLYDTSNDYRSATKEEILTALKTSFLSIYYDGWKFYISHEITISRAVKHGEEQGKEDFVYEV